MKQKQRIKSSYFWRRPKIKSRENNRKRNTGSACNERGSISIAVAILAVSLLAAAALVLDGGRRLGTYSDSRDLADNAARAGAQAIFEEGLRGCRYALLEPVDAIGLTDRYLAQVEPDSFANPRIISGAVSSIARFNISNCAQALVLGSQPTIAERETENARWTISVQCGTISVEIRRDVESGTFSNSVEVGVRESATAFAGELGRTQC